jgi:anti-sigma B factor antagonist
VACEAISESEPDDIGDGKAVLFMTSDAPPGVAPGMPNPWASTSARLNIEGEMTLIRAVELRDALIGALEQQSSSVEVDLSGVNELDTAGVQLLLLAKRTALARNKELRLIGQSPAVVQVLETLNLATYFGAPEFYLFGAEDSA